MSLLQGLVSYWPLNESSGTRADKRGGVDLSATNTPGTTTGPARLGTAASFVAASDQRLSAANPTAVAGRSTDFTFGCWLKPGTATSAIEGLISKGSSTLGNNLEYDLCINPAPGAQNELLFRIQNSAGGSASISTGHLANLRDGNWHLALCWWDSAGTINLQYDNGTVYSQAHTNGSADKSKTLFLGARFGNSGADYNGGLDGAAFWDRMLRAAERTRYYNGGLGLEHPFGFSPRRPLRGLGRGIGRGIAA